MEEKKKTLPRLKDVARLAKVSEAAASMVFSGRGRISENTRVQVLRAAETLGYTPQPRERKKGLIRRTVGVLMLIDREWSFIWHFLTEMLLQIEKELESLNLQAVMIPITEDEADPSIQAKINGQGCRAVFAVHTGRESLFSALEEDGIPVIVVLNNNLSETFFTICSDDFQGACDGVRRLLEMGHRRIDFIDFHRKNLPTLSSDRYFGYRKALEEAGAPFSSSYRLDGCLDEDKLSELLKRTLSGDDPPTAFFCLDDEEAFRVWNALTRIGFTIPGDVSLLAPGDVLDYGKSYIPPISTMKINMTDMGKLAVNMLQNRLVNGLETPQVLKVKPRYMDRGSVLPR